MAVIDRTNIAHKIPRCTKFARHSPLSSFRFGNLYRNEDFPAILLAGYHLMPVDPAPSGYITQHPGVGADYLEDIAVRKGFDAILNPYDG